MSFAALLFLLVGVIAPHLTIPCNTIPLGEQQSAAKKIFGTDTPAWGRVGDVIIECHLQGEGTFGPEEKHENAGGMETTKNWSFDLGAPTQQTGKGPV